MTTHLTIRPKEFFYIAGGTLAVVLIAGGWGYYWATQQLQARTVVLQKALGDSIIASDQINQLTHLQAQYKSLQPFIAALDEALPTTKEQSEITLQLQTLTQQSDMSIASITFENDAGLPDSTSQTVTAGAVLQFPITFQLTGSFQQLETFLTQLEALNRYTDVTSLSIAKSSTNSNILTYTITLNAFLKP